jgi:hypothetical protein
MLDTCQLCDTPDIETMFAQGVLACYSCQELTDSDTPEDDECEEL